MNKYIEIDFKLYKLIVGRFYGWSIILESY